MRPSPVSEPAAESVESISALYLGNILYALERCAISLEAEGKPADAAFIGASEEHSPRPAAAKRTRSKRCPPPAK